MSLAAAGIHCSVQGGPSKFTTGSGSNAAGAGGDGNIFSTGNGNGGGLTSLSGPVGAGGGDPDPGNPNITHPTCFGGTCEDFPATPILGDGVPASAPGLFGAAENFTSGALCVLEPQLSAPGIEGAMMPANWVRPRFRVAATGLDLFEIRIHSPAEKNDLVAYTKQSSWYLPKDIWAGAATADAGIAAGSGFANNAAGKPVTVTIRGINSASPGMPVGFKGDFNIAPVIATGSMVFWTVNSAAVTPDSSKLLGFGIGDEGVADALKLTNLKWAGQIGEDGATLRGFYDTTPLPGFVNGQVRCMGCHTTTPDGSSVIFTDDWPWAKAAATITAGSIGAIPTFIAPGAQAIMKMPWWGTQTMSPAHFAAGDRTLVTTYGAVFKSGKARTTAWQALPSYGPDDKVKFHQLAWIDLEANPTIPVAFATPTEQQYGAPAFNTRQTAALAAKGTAWGLIATGDTGVSDVSPSFSHDGLTIAYTTTDYSPDGHPDATSTTADIKTVPYNNRAGGTAQALPGASDPSYLEYYPSYSADDKLITFTRAPNKVAATDDGPYYNRHGEVMVIPAAGGTPTSLAANIPNACAGDNVAAGIINSWPKWSPKAFSAGGKTYYFLMFSSGRKYGDEFSSQFQLPKNDMATFTGLSSSSQLYLAAVVVDNATNAITTYPAVYIWNQNRVPGAGGAGVGTQYSNLTPAWDAVDLPPLVIDSVPPDIPQ